MGYNPRYGVCSIQLLDIKTCDRYVGWVEPATPKKS